MIDLIKHLIVITIIHFLFQVCEVQAQTKWAIQLQNAKIGEIIKNDFDLIVMDYSRDGSEAGKYTKDSIDLLVKHGTLPIAYLSIGEAEDYRSYWQIAWANSSNTPDWLGMTNPDWGGNYKVRYWDTEWQDEVILPYIDEIIVQGFQGLYLDIVDAYYYWGLPNNPDRVGANETELLLDPKSLNDSAKRMISFIKRVAKHAREKSGNPDFMVIPQNAEGILSNLAPSLAVDYLSFISGIGVESVWFYTKGDSHELRAKRKKEVEYRLYWLNEFIKAGKTVLSIEYMNKNKLRRKEIRYQRMYLNWAKNAGFLPYIAMANADLDEISRKR